MLFLVLSSPLGKVSGWLFVLSDFLGHNFLSLLVRVFFLFVLVSSNFLALSEITPFF